MNPIEFDWLGLRLQEPMAIVTNGLISVFCFFAWLRLRRWKSKANYWWRLFFLTFGISTFFGAFGHAFFQYTGMYGKFPSWTMGCVANVSAAYGMLSFEGFARPTKTAYTAIWMKSLTLLILAIVTQKFVFVAVDAILTYIAYTGVFAYQLSKRGMEEMKFMVMGVIILLPSAFIFLMKLNPHRWLNKDDLSHLLMLGCIYCFYLAMKLWGMRRDNATQHV